MEIYLHPLFEDCFGYRQKMSKFSDQINKMLVSLTRQIFNKGISIRELFNIIDVDQSGELTLDEFQILIRKISSKIDREMGEKLFNSFDTDNSNSISLKEFVDKID